MPDVETIPILNCERHWECPSCGRQHVTKAAQVTSELHSCPSQKGLIVPFVQVSSNAGIPKNSVRHVPIERGDFVGSEKGVRHDGDGKAVMALHTERSDGSHDTLVFAPTAYARLGEIS